LARRHKIVFWLYTTENALFQDLLLGLGQGLESEVVAVMDEGRVALGG
jgi:hypothetical protein